jgi:hypothetical protein
MIQAYVQYYVQLQPFIRRDRWHLIGWGLSCKMQNWIDEIRINQAKYFVIAVLGLKNEVLHLTTGPAADYKVPKVPLSVKEFPELSLQKNVIRPRPYILPLHLSVESLLPAAAWFKKTQI